MVRELSLAICTALMMLLPESASAQVPLDWIDRAKEPKLTYPVTGIHRLGYKTFELIGTGVTACGRVQKSDGKLLVTQDGLYDRALFEVSSEARRVDLGEDQACFVGIVRHKAGKTSAEAAKGLQTPTDSYPFDYWIAP